MVHELADQSKRYWASSGWLRGHGQTRSAPRKARFYFFDLRASVESVMRARYRANPARRFLEALAQHWVVFAALQCQHAGDEL